MGVAKVGENLYLAQERFGPPPHATVVDARQFLRRSAAESMMTAPRLAASTAGQATTGPRHAGTPVPGPDPTSAIRSTSGAPVEESELASRIRFDVQARIGSARSARFDSDRVADAIVATLSRGGPAPVGALTESGLAVWRAIKPGLGAYLAAIEPVVADEALAAHRFALIVVGHFGALADWMADRMPASTRDRLDVAAVALLSRAVARELAAPGVGDDLLAAGLAAATVRAAQCCAAAQFLSEEFDQDSAKVLLGIERADTAQLAGRVALDLAEAAAGDELSVASLAAVGRTSLSRHAAGLGDPIGPSPASLMALWSTTITSGAEIILTGGATRSARMALPSISGAPVPIVLPSLAELDEALPGALAAGGRHRVA
jgi:hypothetical protein